jgi:hypothetical protein
MEYNKQKKLIQVRKAIEAKQAKKAKKDKKAVVKKNEKTGATESDSDGDFDFIDEPEETENSTTGKPIEVSPTDLNEFGGIKGEESDADTELSEEESEDI